MINSLKEKNNYLKKTFKIKRISKIEVKRFM